MYKITIPKPCFEGWENMLPNEQGRHCNACAKTVIDFTAMSDEAVQLYFISNYGKQVCGHFKNTQVQRITIDLPANLFSLQLPSWKKFFISFLIIYGTTFFSIDITIAGERYYVSNTYAKSQGTPILEKEKHQKKKHRRKKIKRTISATYDTFELDGLISLHEIKGCFGKPYSIYDTTREISVEKSQDTSGNTFINASSKNNTSNPGIPLPKPQPMKREFILPVGLAFRNPFSKKKKA